MEIVAYAFTLPDEHEEPEGANFFRDGRYFPVITVSIDYAQKAPNTLFPLVI